MTFEQRMYNSLKRKGLAPKFEHAGIYAILLDREIVYIGKLDRFARTAIEGVQTVRELFERGVRVHILNMGLIENTLTGKRSSFLLSEHSSYQPFSSMK